MKGNRRLLTALRRGIGLGLALVAVWGISLTADFGALGERLSALGARPGLAVSLLTAQMGELPGQDRALTGWGRLMLDSSALMRAGEEPVLAYRAEQIQREEETDGVVDDDDQEEPELGPQSGEDQIVEMTGRGKTGGQYLYQDGVYLYNRTGKELDASILSQGTVDVPLGEGPQILIVHTHGSEAYSQSDGDTYEESDPYRTTDCTHNVVKVGEEIATVFRAYGFQVLHDTNLYDYPAYNGAYDRSLAAVKQWLADYPTISIVLDVHRDALVGSNDTGLEHPRWTDNLAFAVRLQKNLVTGYDSLARPIVLRSSRYNQQLLPGSRLVEVGGHGNTLTEAIAGARLWADNVARTLLDMKEGG